MPLLTLDAEELDTARKLLGELRAALVSGHRRAADELARQLLELLPPAEAGLSGL